MIWAFKAYFEYYTNQRYHYILLPSFFVFLLFYPYCLNHFLIEFHNFYLSILSCFVIWLKSVPRSKRKEEEEQQLWVIQSAMSAANVTHNYANFIAKLCLAWSVCQCMCVSSVSGCQHFLLLSFWAIQTQTLALSATHTSHKMDTHRHPQRHIHRYKHTHTHSYIQADTHI